MQKIQITFIPTAEPEGEDISRADLDALGELPKSYMLCARSESGRYRYEHKIILTNNGEILQIVTRDSRGQFTVATLDNAFSLTGAPLRMELEDINGDRSEYRLILSDQLLSSAPSQVILHKEHNPQIAIAEVTNIEGTLKTKALSYIGTEDIRPSMQAKVVVPPGQPMEVSCINGGDIRCKF